MSGFACICGGFSGLDNDFDAVSLENNDEIDLPSGVSGWGYVHVGNDEEFARFTWSNDATVTLREATTNVIDMDVDTFLCIYDGGTNIKIKNRLGGSKTIRYLLYYS